MTNVNDARAIGENVVASVDFMTAEGSKGELPLRVREHFFDVANRRIDELRALQESETQIGKRWGVSQNTINKIRQRSGGLGVKVLFGMRKDLRCSIDEILGLPALSDESGATLRSTVRPKANSQR